MSFNNLIPRFLSPTSMFSGLPNEFPILRKDLWSLIFPPEMNISERFQVKAARPKVTNTVKEIKYKNFTTKYKGPTKYENITVEFRDVVGPSVMQKLWSWQREHFDPITGCGSYPSVYKKNLTLYLEDECGNPVQKWNFYGCFIESLDGGDLDMTSDAEEVRIIMSLAYDYCIPEY